MVRQDPVEFFFYAESLICAGALADALESLGYQVAPVSHADRFGRYCITGWSTPIADNVPGIESWYEHMLELAIEHGCEFDGFGEPCLDDDDDDDDLDTDELVEFFEMRASLEAAKCRREAIMQIAATETEDEAMERLAMQAAEDDFMKWMRYHGRLR